MSDIGGGFTPGTGSSGTATLNFGSAPGTNVVSVAVTGQTPFLSSSRITLWMSGDDSTATHNGYEHMVVPIRLNATGIVAGVGFTVNGITDWRLDGTFTVRWSWV